LVPVPVPMSQTKGDLQLKTTAKSTCSGLFMPNTRQMCWTLFPASNASSFWLKDPLGLPESGPVGIGDTPRNSILDCPMRVETHCPLSSPGKPVSACQPAKVDTDRGVQRTLVYRSSIRSALLMLSFCPERLLIAARLEQYR
jgi:hypothetical protein